MKIIIFGTGKLFELHKHRFSNMKIVAYLDNNPKKWDTYIDSTKIVSPDQVYQFRYDYILIVSKYYEQMRKQLLDLGINKDVILDCENTKIFGMRSVTRFENIISEIFKKNILLVTHSLSLTGAPLMLLNMAELLYQNGYKVTLYALEKDKLLYEFIRKNISVNLFSDFVFDENEVKYYFGKYDLIIVNTVTLYKLVMSIKFLKIPILWWLHEEENIYEEYQIKSEDLVCSSNILVYGVSGRAVRAFDKYSNGQLIKKLAYGIRLNKKVQNRIRKNKLVFAVIGSVDKRKAQDIFVEAIRLCWHDWSSKAEFWIIGSIAEEKKQEFEKIEGIKVWGALEHDELEEIYINIDVIVCPSLNDPLPVVLAEGMMNKKVCIASDMTGTAEYITPYKDGLICKSGDINSLISSIQWIVDNSNRIDEIGEKAFAIYEKNFSIQQFERNILAIINEIF